MSAYVVCVDRRPDTGPLTMSQAREYVRKVRRLRTPRTSVLIATAAVPHRIVEEH